MKIGKIELSDWLAGNLMLVVGADMKWKALITGK